MKIGELMVVEKVDTIRPFFVKIILKVAKKNKLGLVGIAIGNYTLLIGEYIVPSVAQDKFKQDGGSDE